MDRRHSLYRHSLLRRDKTAAASGGGVQHVCLFVSEFGNGLRENCFIVVRLASFVLAKKKSITVVKKFKTESYLV